MKSLIGLAAAALMMVGTGIASPAKAQEGAYDGLYDRSAPRIVSVTSTGTRGNVLDATHTVTLYTGAQPLRAVTLQVARNIDFDEIDVESDDIEVMFEGRGNIPAKVYERGDLMVVEFAQPVPPLTTFKVQINDVGTLLPFYPGLISYQVNGYHVGLTEPIPYGLARIQGSLVN